MSNEITESDKSQDPTNVDRHYRILVADDSTLMRKQLAQILRSTNWEVVAEAQNGLEVLKYCKENADTVDLITLDITMPEMDGITTLQQLQASEIHIPVIMISSLGKEDIVRKAIMLGAKDFIVKPFQQEAVIRRILHLLENRPPEAT